MTGKTTFRISVRDLAASACQPESLSKGFSGRTRAMEGIREHTRLQDSWPDGWEREVAVSLTVVRKRFDLEIFGRMDGRRVTDTRLCVEEIKTCRRDPSIPASDPDPRHLAQLKCYAYMTARQLDRPSADLRLTYARPADGAVATWERAIDIHTLEAFFNGLVSQYTDLLGTRAAWERIRNLSIRSLPFPYGDFRDGQRDLSEAVYKVIRHNRILFARAPTGTGKTMAALFPAVKALGLGYTDKIFYLTAKSPGRTVAQKAVKDMANAGARLKCITITAKQKTCFTPDTPCDMGTCHFALGYYVKLARAMAHAASHDHFDQGRIEETARRFDICPFELSLDLSLNCDIIICDLNYAFDPRVYLKRFFDRNIQNLTFLMDEAHNLPDRLRSMYSADLAKSGILALQEVLRDEAPGLSGALVRINREMIRLRKRFPETRDTGSPEGFKALAELPGPLMEALDEFAERADIWLDDHRKSPLREAVLDGFYTVSGFLNMARFFGENYRFLMASDRDADLNVRLFCMDPSPVFSKLIKRCTSAIFFSATFFPFPYYAQVLLGIARNETGKAGSEPEPPQGSDDQTLIPHTIALPSPFSGENFRLLVHPGINTTYRHRHRYHNAVAGIIVRTIARRPGNYLVFFSSYAYMDAVLDEIKPDGLPADIQVQAPGMTEAERQDFLDSFTEDSRITGFAVMGGIFGEGIDLTGDRLIGTIVVGVGLPQVNREQDEIRAYYDARGEDGFFFAYQMPGFNRVLQATGRLIRSHDDRGVALLLDERFLRSDYLPLFPAEWAGFEVTRDTESLNRLLDTFWGDA